MDGLKKTQKQVDRLRTLQESYDTMAEGFENILSKIVLASIDPSTYMPMDKNALDAWWAVQSTDKEITE